MNSKIAIIGCGWLGLPLAKSLVQHNYHVHGSTTSDEKLKDLKDNGITPFLIALNESGIEGKITDFLTGVDVLVINVPPRLRRGSKENYTKKMQFLYQAVKTSNIKKIIFVSSTSVYGNIQGDVTEDTLAVPQTESGKQLLVSENMFKNDDTLKSTIIRFGGLIGPTRHPVTMLSGRKSLYNGNAHINLIHLEDCIGIINAIISNDWWNELFNGVYPHHPSKKEYYTTEAEKRGLTPPEYLENTRSKGKKIISSRLIHVKKYDFTTTILN
ncbi:MAG: SDR family oxidoreductase [Bacteroidota bacterium]